MKTYIGVKAVQAEPHTIPAKKEGEITPADPLGQRAHPDLEGYKVVYPDGYTSWSPKDVFEEAYVEVPDWAADTIVGVLRNYLLGTAAQ